MRKRSSSWHPRKFLILLKPLRKLTVEPLRFTSTKPCVYMPAFPMSAARKVIFHSIDQQFSFSCPTSENQKEMVKKRDTRLCPEDQYSLDVVKIWNLICDPSNHLEGLSQPVNGFTALWAKAFLPIRFVTLGKSFLSRSQFPHLYEGLA